MIFPRNIYCFWILLFLQSCVQNAPVAQEEEPKISDNNKKAYIIDKIFTSTLAVNNEFPYIIEVRGLEGDIYFFRATNNQVWKKSDTIWIGNKNSYFCSSTKNYIPLLDNSCQQVLDTKPINKGSNKLKPILITKY